MSPAVITVDAAWATRRGPQHDVNQDYAGLCCDEAFARDPRGLVFAIADGVSGARGGRIAAELAVRGFIDGHYASEPAAGVPRTAERVMASINSWLHAQGATDPALRQASTTFTALVLQGRSAHVIHAGDSRAFLLHDEQLTLLTQDHTLPHPDLAHVLTRALGMEPALRLDHAVQPLRVHDRLLLCTDGVHGVLGQQRLRDLLLRRRSPGEDAQALIDAAAQAGTRDDATCIVIDVLALPEASAPELQTHYAALPLLLPPAVGEVVDDFEITALLSDGRYSRLMVAQDRVGGAEVVLKFPQPRVAGARTFHLAFVREAWVAARVRSPWLGEMIELPPERQTRLYAAMPRYRGETLEQRLTRAPRPSLAEGCAIGLKLARAIASLHRAGIVHRDIKPENVMLTADGGLRLLDLGVVRLPRIEDFPATDIPGTPSYMAPELFEGEPGSEASDQFAWGVTLYRTFTGRWPYGEIEAFSHPRFGRPAPLTKHRPDLPAWLDRLLARTVDPDPRARFQDILEVANELEDGLSRGDQRSLRRVPLVERDPVRFWKLVSALLAVALLACLLHQGLRADHPAATPGSEAQEPR